VTSVDIEPGICQRLELSVGEALIYSLRAPYKEGETPNEDRVAVVQIDDSNYILAVADGVGGSPGGAVASAIVVDKIVEYFGANSDSSQVTATIVAALEEAHQEIRATGSGCASTVALAHIDAGSLRTAHVGDSVVMLCGQRGKVKLETIAHSPVGYALEAGVLSEDEAFSHEDRHVVSNIVGGQDMSMTLGATVPIALRDTLLLATDGVTDNLRKEEIIELIRKGRLVDCGEALAAAGRARMMNEGGEGKPDDMTFVLFRRSVSA